MLYISRIFDIEMLPEIIHRNSLQMTVLSMIHQNYILKAEAKYFKHVFFSVYSIATELR